MSAYMTHQQFYARDAAVCAENQRLNRQWVDENGRRRGLASMSFRDYDRSLGLRERFECEGTLRFSVEDEPTLAVCDNEDCEFEVAVPRRVNPEERLIQFLQRSGLPIAFIDKSFTRTTDNVEGLNACRHFTEGTDKPPALHGPAGVGKTHLLTRTGAAMCRQGKRVIYRDFVSLLRTERDFMDRKHGVRPLQLCLDAEVLILDDLGAERSTPWSQEQLQWVVDERYKANRPILVATNLEVIHWPQELGERTASRLASMTRPTSMGGADMRLESA